MIVVPITERAGLRPAVRNHAAASRPNADGQAIPRREHSPGLGYTEPDHSPDSPPPSPSPCGECPAQSPQNMRRSGPYITNNTTLRDMRERVERSDLVRNPGSVRRAGYRPRDPGEIGSPEASRGRFGHKAFPDFRFRSGFSAPVAASTVPRPHRVRAVARNIEGVRVVGRSPRRACGRSLRYWTFNCLPAA